jgi:hypothetical protein
MGFIDPRNLSRVEVEEVKPGSQRQHCTALLTQRHRADRLGYSPGTPIASPEIGPMDARRIGVDPVETLFLNVPERSFAKAVRLGAECLDPQHED